MATIAAVSTPCQTSLLATVSTAPPPTPPPSDPKDTTSIILYPDLTPESDGGFISNRRPVLETPTKPSGARISRTNPPPRALLSVTKVNGEPQTVPAHPVPSSAGESAQNTEDTSPGDTTLDHESIVFTPGVKTLELAAIEMKDEIKKQITPDNGFTYLFYEKNGQSTFYKVGSSKDNLNGRESQHKNGCKRRTWTLQAHPRLPLSQFRRLESLAQAELTNLQYVFMCICGTNHKEYFWGEKEKAADILDFWNGWLAKEEPYDTAGNLKHFWLDRLDRFFLKPAVFYKHFFCGNAECIPKRHLGAPACDACLRAGWEAWTKPEPLDILEYECRMNLSWTKSRAIVQWLDQCQLGNEFFSFPSTIPIFRCVEQACLVGRVFELSTILIAVLLRLGYSICQTPSSLLDYPLFILVVFHLLQNNHYSVNSLQPSGSLACCKPLPQPNTQTQDASPKAPSSLERNNKNKNNNRQTENSPEMESVADGDIFLDRAADAGNTRAQNTSLAPTNEGNSGRKRRKSSNI